MQILYQNIMNLHEPAIQYKTFHLNKNLRVPPLPIHVNIGQFCIYHPLTLRKI